jgi:hypothetical protein
MQTNNRPGGAFDRIPPSRNTLWGLAFSFLALIFLGLRVCLLLFRPEFYINIEELYMGTIAKGVSDGFIMPLAEYMYHPYEGGTLLFGLSAYPFFALLGPTHFAMKITALAYSFAAFSLWYFFMLRFFGKASAVFFGLLSCFAPFGYILVSLWAMGTHPQNALFDIIILFSFYSLFFNPSPERERARSSPWSAAVFGFASGLGIYFCYFSTLTIIVCIVTWLTVPHRALGAKTRRALLLSFILGLTPFLYCNLVLRAGGAKSLLSSMGGPEWASAGFLGSVIFFLRVLFKDAYWFSGGAPHCAVGCYHIFYSSLMALSLIWLVWTHRGALLKQCTFFLPPHRREDRGCDEYRATPIIVYIALYFFIAGAFHLERRIAAEIQTRQFTGYRFFSVLFPYLFSVMAIFLARLWAHRHRPVRMVSVAAAILVVLFGCMPITINGILPSISHKGYSFYLLGWRAAQKNVYWDTPARGLELSKKISTIADRDDFIDGFCEIRWWDAIEADERPPIPPATRQSIDALITSNVASLAKHIRSVEDRYKRQFYKALGRVLCLHYVYDKELQFDKCDRLLAVTDRQFRSSVFEGFGQVAGSYGPNKRNIGAIAPRIPKEYETAFKRGIDGAATRPYIQIVH